MIQVMCRKHRGYKGRKRAHRKCAGCKWLFDLRATILLYNFGKADLIVRSR